MPQSGPEAIADCGLDPNNSRPIYAISALAIQMPDRPNDVWRVRAWDPAPSEDSYVQPAVVDYQILDFDCMLPAPRLTLLTSA